MKPSDLNVAVLYPGNRVDKMLVPLQTTDMDVAVEPDDAYERDVVIADNADRDLGVESLRNLITDSKLVYRMRGDLYRELELWDMHPIKKWAAHKVVELVDGVIAVTQFLADKAKRESGVNPVGSAGMWIDVDEYPNVTHTDSELRAITLTNANYVKKVIPILDWAPTVNQVLAETGGHWLVYGEGENAPKLEHGLADYEHVHFEGYTDSPKYELGEANIMLHPSNLDGQPNGVLEGLASSLPVVTTDFIAFEEWKFEHGAPLLPMQNTADLDIALEILTDPTTRREVGNHGRQYASIRHTPARIGNEYEAYLTRLVG